MNVQSTLEGEWEVNVLAKHSNDGAESRTITLATFKTEEEAQMHKRLLELNGGGE